MKSLLILGAVFSCAEASQDVQNLFAYARQLNQSLGLPARVTSRRLETLQMPTLSENCTVSCQRANIECAYSDSVALTEQMNGGDTVARMRALGDLMGSLCLHREAVKCAAEESAATGICKGLYDRTAPHAACICDACPDLPLLYQNIPALEAALGTPAAEQADALYTAMCPMSSILTCLTVNTVCASALSLESLENALNGHQFSLDLMSDCKKANKPTSYTTSYSLTSPTGCAGDESGAIGLLQLNLLAGSFSLLSILN
eukprot:s2965_g2.t1